MVRFAPLTPQELKLAIQEIQEMDPETGIPETGIHPVHGHINTWDVSHVTNMDWMFLGIVFNQPLDTWNVKNVTSMKGMFSNSNFNHPLEDWNVSNVTNMSSMFEGSTFNQPLNKWKNKVSNVTDMNKMFKETWNFNQPLNKWNVSNVSNMSQMFYFSKVFNQPLNEWNVSSVTNMSRMFSECNFNQPLNNWDVSKVTDMSSMFFYNTSFNQTLPWKLHNDVRTTHMFIGTGRGIEQVMIERHSPATIRNRNGKIVHSFIKRANHPNMMRFDDGHMSPIEADAPDYTKRLMANIRKKSPELRVVAETRKRSRSSRSRTRRTRHK
jgi:surface protein